MASLGICSIPDCARAVRTKGMCNAHYLRLLRHGDPCAGGLSPGEPLRFLNEALVYTGDDCLLWPFGLCNTGYGQVRWNAKPRTVHSVVCECVHGPRPSTKHEVAHSCGERRCCNPRHLRWATRAENEADKVAHERSNRGERQGASKLTETAVRAIRAAGNIASQAFLARQYGVCQSTISDVRSGRRWGWLT